MNKEERKAYGEGWGAYYEGASLGDCPYPFEENGAEWEDGYNDAKKLDRGRVFA